MLRIASLLRLAAARTGPRSLIQPDPNDRPCTRMLGAARDGVFTDMRLTVHDTVAAGDTVVLRFTNSGVRTGELLGMPATGRPTEWLGIGIYRVRDGRIAEAWFGEDTLAMLLPPGAALPL